MGNPDLPPPAHVIEKLCEVAAKPNAHGYSASRDIPGLRKAQANYYARRFGVAVDADREIVEAHWGERPTHSIRDRHIAGYRAVGSYPPFSRSKRAPLGRRSSL